MGFKKGTSGNPGGRPKGARNRRTVLAEALLEQETGELVRVAINLAKSGDPTALRLCFERIYPKPTEKPVSLPELKEATTPVQRLRVLLEAVADGRLAPSQALRVAQILELEQAHEIWSTAIFQAAVIAIIGELGPEAIEKLMEKLKELRDGRRENLALAPPAAPLGD